MWIDKPCHQLVLVTGQIWGAKQWKYSLVSLPVFWSLGAVSCCVPTPVTISFSFLSSLSLLNSSIPDTSFFFFFSKRNKSFQKCLAASIAGGNYQTGLQWREGTVRCTGWKLEVDQLRAKIWHPCNFYTPGTEAMHGGVGYPGVLQVALPMYPHEHSWGICHAQGWAVEGLLRSAGSRGCAGHLPDSSPDELPM